MKIRLPEWSRWLDVPLTLSREPVRHRVFHGGRGGAKSWTIAHKIVERARLKPLHILCTREFQNSIRDSSKKLIEDCIDRMGFGPRGDRYFTITEREIRGRNGSLITFIGLNGRDAAIKSLEGFDLAWVEEAATLSQSSIDALIPTIRKAGSEIWWSYNPRFASDPVDQMFRGQSTPPGTIMLEVHHYDNPWFPKVLSRDMEYDRVRDPEKHAHIWLGRYVIRSEAQVFRNWAMMPFDTPPDAILRFGADWGFSQDPTVLVRCFIGRWAAQPGASDVISDANGTCLFVDQEAYAIGCPVDAIPALFAGNDSRRPPRWENKYGYSGLDDACRSTITADSARPETIDYLARRGFNIVPAIKGPGSVEDGVNFLNSYDIVVHPRCRHLADELIHYSWAVDRQTGEILSKLADTDNHVIDALRYALEGARKARSGKVQVKSTGRRAMMMDPYRNGLSRNGPRNCGAGWGSTPGKARGILENY